MDIADTGTQFEFSFAEGTSWNQIVGFQMAGEIWSSYLKDDVAVRIHVETTDLLPEYVIGGALPGKKKELDYNNFKKEFLKDITSDNDLLAFDNLVSEENEFSALVNGEELNKTKKIKLTNANAKALGVLKYDSKKLDGYIVMNDLTGQDTVSWNYDFLQSNSNTIGSDKLDFLSVALHEIGHILGFVSGVDNDDWLKVVTESQTKNKEIKDDAMKFANPLDLYRYSGEGIGFGSLDFSVGGNPYFSIDGGTTNLGGFSTGEAINLGGDGYQASHWKYQDNPQGIMNPALKPGQINKISGLDVTAMDVIGWNVKEQVNLDWQEIHKIAVEKADTVAIGDHTKDIEKMINDSKEYKGRRSRSSGHVNNSWQVGLWEMIKFQKLDLSNLDRSHESLELNSESNMVVGSRPNFLVDKIGHLREIPEQPSFADRDLASEEALSDRNHLKNIDFKPYKLDAEPLLNQDTEIVSSDSQQQDLLLSGGLIPSQQQLLPSLNQPLIVPIY